MPALVSLRLAVPGDVAELSGLIRLSVGQLQAADYSDAQRGAALGAVFGVDPVLVEDGTYFVAVRGGQICGCGGWSRRATPFGTHRSPARDDRLLDPDRDAARIRALFVHPAHARTGVGSAILHECENAARRAGFGQAELTATLTGVRLFARHGYAQVEPIEVALENGIVLPVVRMSKRLA
jgi:GNAT superfamily N-acetyltransferase